MSKKDFLIVSTLFLISLSMPAHADPVLSLGQTLVKLLTNTYAKIGFLLACAVVGWMAWAGVFAMKYFWNLLIGGVFVLGGAALYNMWFSGVGAGTGIAGL